MESVGVGLVGAGAYGAFCLSAFEDIPEVRVVAICDSDKTRAERFAAQYNAAAYTQIESLLADPSVEIVALNTPPYLHGKQGLLTLQAGKHLFCEKPLALTLDDAQTLVDTAREKGLRLTIDYVMRRNPLWQLAASLQASGALGPLLYASLTNHAAGLDLPAHHWFWDKSKSGGIWVEHGVHFFDALAWVTNAEGEIIAGQSFVNSDYREDRVQALARYGDVAAHFYHGFTHNGYSERTTAQLVFALGYITLYEWVPTYMELTASAVVTGAIGPFLSPRWSIQRRADKNMLKLTIAVGMSKSALYQRCIQEGMRELAQAVRNPSLNLTVRGEHGVSSLKMALAAEAAQQLIQA